MSWRKIQIDLNITLVVFKLREKISYCWTVEKVKNKFDLLYLVIIKYLEQS
jgi:hypothetical protein